MRIDKINPPAYHSVAYVNTYLVHHIMNKWLLSAFLLSFVTLGAHVFGGGPQYYDPLLASGLPVEMVAVFALVWHMASIMLAGSAALLVAVWSERGRAHLVWFVAVQYAGFAALFVFYGQTMLATVWQLPQWMVFLPIAGLALLGLRGGRSATGNAV
jgi:hypothetical protein